MRLRVKYEGDALGVFSSSSHENFEAIGGKLKYNDCIAVFEKKNNQDFIAWITVGLPTRQ